MPVTPTPTGLRVYRSQPRRLLIAGALLLALAVSWGSILTPDPVTHTVAGPGEYLWEVVPGIILVLVLVWRGLRSRLVTSPRGLLAKRVTGTDWLPWSRIRRFEIRRMAGGRAAAVVARLDDDRTVRLWSYAASRRSGGHSDGAESLLGSLAADREDRLAGSGLPTRVHDGNTPPLP